MRGGTMPHTDLVRSVRIERILPCLADETKIRIIARTDRRLDEVLPYLYAVIPNSSYSEKGGFITYMKGPRLITIYNTGVITITKVKDEEEAAILLNEIKERINNVYRNRDEIDLSKVKTRKKIRLGPLDIYQYLPKTNCGECGEQTCMAYAAKLLSLQKSIKDCKPLRKPENSGLRESLISLLKLAGYDTE